MDQKLTVLIMSSTHWDREWYEPYQGFRWRLVNVTEDAMDKLESHPEFGTFTFDGQTIVLEDFAEAAPDQKARLQRLMQEGRIKVGPWYVMPDAFLPSGESHIRNLQMGTAIAKLKPGVFPEKIWSLDRRLYRAEYEALENTQEG